MTAWGSDRPASVSISSALSNMAESLPSGSITGMILAISAPNNSEANRLWRACIQLMLPRRVLISPLWHR